MATNAPGATLTGRGDTRATPDMLSPSRIPFKPHVDFAAPWVALVGGDIGDDRRPPATHGGGDRDDGFDIRRRHDGLLIGEDPFTPGFDMRTLIGAVERVHLLRACSTAAPTLSPLIETTIARLAHGAWVRAPYVQKTAPPNRATRVHLCHLLSRIYAPFWSQLARADIMRQPVVMAHVGSPPNPADVLRCLRRDFGLSRITAAHIKAAAPNDPVGAADTIARILCHVHVGIAGAVALASDVGSFAAVTESSASTTTTTASTTTPPTAATTMTMTEEATVAREAKAFLSDICAVETAAAAATTAPRTAIPTSIEAQPRIPIRLLYVGVSAGCPSRLPSSLGADANGIRFAMVASRVARPRSDGYTWRWVAWVLWDTRAPCFWEASDDEAMASADNAVGCPPGSFGVWLRAAAMRPGTTLPPAVLSPQPPPACQPTDRLLLEVATLLASRLTDVPTAEGVRISIARATTGWAPLWDEQIAPYVRALLTPP